MNTQLDAELRSGHLDTEMDRQVEKAQEALLARYAPVAEPIAERYPNVRVIHVPDAGHLPWIDDPERVVGEIGQETKTNTRRGQREKERK